MLVRGSRVRALLVGVAIVLSAGTGAPARADEVRDREARALYADGKTAFESRRYDDAYKLFKRAYLTSQQPALLFNMASCLQELDRPREAADELRTYLRLAPDDPDRPAIERRILALDEKQRLLDAERGPRETHAPPRETHAPPRETHAPPRETPPSLTPRETPPAHGVLFNEPEPRPRRSRRGLVIGLGVAGAVVVAAIAVGLGVGLTSGSDFHASTLGTHPGTR
jgi:tetratricopeptide (TPR) repeat protein